MSSSWVIENYLQVNNAGSRCKDWMCPFIMGRCSEGEKSRSRYIFVSTWLLSDLRTDFLDLHGDCVALPLEGNASLGRQDATAGLCFLSYFPDLLHHGTFFPLPTGICSFSYSWDRVSNLESLSLNNAPKNLLINYLDSDLNFGRRKGSYKLYRWKTKPSEKNTISILRNAFWSQGW